MRGIDMKIKSKVNGLIIDHTRQTEDILRLDNAKYAELDYEAHLDKETSQATSQDKPMKKSKDRKKEEEFMSDEQEYTERL